MNLQEKEDGVEVKKTNSSAEIEILDLMAKTAGTIAHDINNFLVAIYGNLSIAKVSSDPGSKTHIKLEKAEKACFMLQEYTSNLNLFTRAGIPRFKKVVISRTLKNAFSAHNQEKIKRELNIDEDLEIPEIDQEMIKILLSNVIKNSVNALDENGTIIASIENEVLNGDSSIPLKEGNYIKIKIQDNGPGIPSEKLESVFETTLSSNKGFGLPLSRYIVVKHNGYINLTSEPGRGTTCTIYLPVCQ